MKLLLFLVLSLPSLVCSAQQHYDLSKASPPRQETTPFETPWWLGVLFVIFVLDHETTF
jgi:hypothetical protein